MSIPKSNGLFEVAGGSTDDKALCMQKCNK